MPTRPAKYGALANGGVRLRGYDNRRSASRRGYDGTWKALRESKLQRDPWCAHCLKEQRHTPANEVDHIRPFKGKADPLRLDWDNLQSLCKSCHSTKTAKDRRSGACHSGESKSERSATSAVLVDQRPPGGGVQSRAF